MKELNRLEVITKSQFAARAPAPADSHGTLLRTISVTAACAAATAAAFRISTTAGGTGAGVMAGNPLGRICAQMHLTALCHADSACVNSIYGSRKMQERLRQGPLACQDHARHGG